MIQVHIFLTEHGKISGFDSTGHSNLAAHGQDIVCAGVSSLTQSALLGIGEYLHRDVDYSAASGKLQMKLKGDPDELTESILRTMLLGLREIAKIAPKAVKISEIRG